MKRIPRILVTMVMAAIPFAVALAGEMGHTHAAAGASALDPLKQLAGDWVGKAGPSGGQMMDVTVTYRVTANGSTVMETLFPGGPEEMVTMYTMDKGGLTLTHYCAAGNQPRMKARKGAAANELVFDFAGGANINPAKDQFMHNARLVFVDDDHLRSEWTDWKDGRKMQTMVFELERKK
jgi:hypothetical protein